MPILRGDIKLVASQVMDDVPEGGGAPTPIVIQDGVSNSVFTDVSETDRAGGRVSLRKLHVSVQTNDRDRYSGGNVIIADGPDDPNVSITLFSTKDVFDRRVMAQTALEAYLIDSSEWPAYLLENHVIGQRTLQLFQRTGGAAPNVGRTLILVYQEGQPTERKQAVRITNTEVVKRAFTISVGGNFQDFEAEVVSCDISDALRFNFPGSPPGRGYSRDVSKTLLRDTTVADAAVYYGVQKLESAVVIGDTAAKALSVYTQLVPSARTETVALDQRPAATRSLEIATVPRLVTVGSAPHTRRQRVGQENRGFSWVEILKPFPAPNSLIISYLALGNWYTLQDDGAGGFTGSGVGTVNYANGSVSITLPSLPDSGSSIIYSWGEKSAFKNLSGLATFRAPEYGFVLQHTGIVPGTLVIKWLSGGVLKTSTDASGRLTAGAAGEINYATGQVTLRPLTMIDAGGEFAIEYDYRTRVKKTVPATIDAGGFATVALDDVPVAGTVSLKWKTVRSVSNTSGSQISGSAAYKGPKITTSQVTRPRLPSERPPPLTTRVPLSVKEGLNGDVASAPGMYPGGTRLLSGEVVFIAVFPTANADGYGYDVPDMTGLTWLEDERSKVFEGIAYKRWGYHLPEPVAYYYSYALPAA